MSETKKTKGEQLKALFNSITEYTAKFLSVELKFTDAKLADGSVIRFPEDKLAKGVAVTIITEEGELPITDSPADMPYTLEDGTMFTIVNGMVDVLTEVAETPEGTEEVVAPEMGVKPASTEAKPKRVIKSQVEEHVFSIEFENEIVELDFSEVIKSHTDKIVALETENKTLKEKFEAQFKITNELAATIEMIADEPSGEGAEKQKIKEKTWDEMTPLEQYRAYKNK